MINQKRLQLAHSTSATLRRNKKTSMLINLHIPKTAGTTLRMIIDREYDLERKLQIEGLYSSSDFVKLYGRDTLNSVDVISGHQYFGLHEHIDVPCKYIAMLRDPIERVLSTYKHTARMGEQDMGWLKRLTTHEQGSNLQTKMLAGGELDLGRAINNINNSFSVVGVSEMFDESVLLMQQKLAWSLPYYVIENPSHNKIKSADIDDDIIDMIREANRVDIELYDYCINRLREEIVVLGDSFQKLLTEFITQNSLNRNKITQVHVGPGAPENIPLNDLRYDQMLPVVGPSKK